MFTLFTPLASSSVYFDTGTGRAAKVVEEGGCTEKGCLEKDGVAGDIAYFKIGGSNDRLAPVN